MLAYVPWFHDCIGWFAVRLEDGEVTGIHGPISIHWALDNEIDPATFPFDDCLEVIQGARESPEQYLPLDV